MPARHFALVAALLLTLSSARVFGADDPDEPKWSAAEKPLSQRMGSIRKVPEDARGAATATLALDIAKLPASPNKLDLAVELGGLSTEGDYGHQVLQQVAATLAMAVRERPVPWTQPQDSDVDKFLPALLPAYAYRTLAVLAKYEHVTVALRSDVHYRDALEQLDANDRERASLDFSLNDLSGMPWRLSDLRGKVVLVNFWATWCPPCRKEIPDLMALYERFGAVGFVVLGISDEDVAKIQPFLSRQPISYPVLLDPRGAVKKKFMVDGIPKSFLYDRSGRLVAQAIDARTQHQFLDMLKTAGLQ